AFSAELMAAIQASFNSIGLTLSGGLGPLAAQLGSALNAGANGFIGAIQAGETALANLAGAFTAGFTGAIQAGQTLVANFLTQLGNLGFSFNLPAFSAELMAAIQASFNSIGLTLSGGLGPLAAQLGSALNAGANGFIGAIQAGETALANLAGAFTAGFTGAIQAGQSLVANFLTQLGNLGF